MMDGFFRRLVRNAGWGLGFVWVDFLVGLATTTITARALGASDFGRVALVTAAVGVEALVGPAFEPAVTPPRLLMVAVGLTTVTFWSTPAALGSGHPGIATMAVGLGVLVDAILLLLLVPVEGPTGAALAAIGGAVASASTVALLLPLVLRRVITTLPGRN
jgi:O-antigen/teichoic acid export membrane protein